MAAPMKIMARRPADLISVRFRQQFTLLSRNNHSSMCPSVVKTGNLKNLTKNPVPGVCHGPKHPSGMRFGVRGLTCQTFCKQTLQSHNGHYDKYKDTRLSCPIIHSKLLHVPHCNYISASRTYSQTNNNGNTNPSSSLILGIETSCDDTGAAVVDQSGRVVGEALNSQTRIHVEMGGIIPHVARDLHRQNIEGVVQAALVDAGVSLQDLDAIACTVEPGLLLSLDVGTKYAKKLVLESGKPFIPIHHMEAHALTARMIEPIAFPFLVLLISGGHSLLAVAQDVDDFLLLGTSLDDAPGDAFDKTARKLKLKNLRECAGLSGGASIEKLAQGGDPHAYPLTTVMSHMANCDFSFAGPKEAIRRIILAEELKHGVGAVDVIPTVADVCATFQYYVLHHLAKRVQRALLFCEMTELLPIEKRTLVISGGVGSNSFIRDGLQRMCDYYDCRVVCPPPKLCTDNGIMIAWNGMEKWKVGRGIATDPESIDIKAKSPLGRDIREEVEKCSIKLRRIKLI